jgi:hypothetical protein
VTYRDDADHLVSVWKPRDRGQIVEGMAAKEAGGETLIFRSQE